MLGQARVQLLPGVIRAQDLLKGTEFLRYLIGCLAYLLSNNVEIAGGR
jgi:hypothetical protein